MQAGGGGGGTARGFGIDGLVLTAEGGFRNLGMNVRRDGSVTYFVQKFKVQWLKFNSGRGDDFGADVFGKDDDLAGAEAGVGDNFPLIAAQIS